MWWTSTRCKAIMFAAAVLDDTPVPTPLTDAVANMRVIEALVDERAGRTRG